MAIIKQWRRFSHQLQGWFRTTPADAQRESGELTRSMDFSEAPGAVWSLPETTMLSHRHHPPLLGVSKVKAGTVPQ